MDSDSTPPKHRRHWPSPLAILFLGAMIVIYLVGRYPANDLNEPEAGMAQWALDPSATASLDAYLAAGLSQPIQATVDGDFHSGISLGLYSQDVDYDYGDLIKEVGAHEAGWISLITNMFQENGTSTAMEPATRRTVQERIIRDSARQAHETGLNVVLFPLVLLSDPTDDQWRGNLEPDDLDEWFENYTTEILRLATLAETEKIEMLSIGSEFSSFEVHTERWEELIEKVRQAYSGQLIYSANWDHYQYVPFWNKLDAVGLSGYYELTLSLEPTLEELVERWSQIRTVILTWKSIAEVIPPIVFTEVGYANQDGANMYPWDYTSEAEPDPAEQALCYEAFIRVWHGQPQFAGVYFYNWFGYDTLDDTGYSPRGKPAAQLIKAWFKVLGGK